MSKIDGKQVDNSHIIPRVYLKNFLYEDAKFNNESVYIAKKENPNEWKRKGIEKKPFAAHQFYDFSTIPDTSQTVENFLGKIETAISSVFRKIKLHKELSHDDYVSLVRFIFSMKNRTILQQKNWQDFVNTLYKWYADIDSTENKKITNEYFNNYEDFSKFYLLMTDKIVSESKLSKTSFFILRNETDIPFITSDNPVVMVNLYKNEIEKISGEKILQDITINRKSILLPISDKSCIFYNDYINTKGNTNLLIQNPEIVIYLNLLQLTYSDEYIISNQDNSLLNFQKLVSNSHMTGTYLLIHTANEEYKIPCDVINSELSIEVSIKKDSFPSEIINQKLQDVILFSNETEQHMKTPLVSFSENNGILNVKFSNLPFEIERL